MIKTAILNYGSGNVFSLNNALRHIGVDNEIISSKLDMGRFDQFILPGVGAFAACVQSLESTGFASEIFHQATAGKKILGICVGMQILFNRGFEFGCHKGLGLFNGDVVGLPEIDDNGDPMLRPHIGWAKLNVKHNSQAFSQGVSLFDELNASCEYYFAHSYMAVPKEKDVCLAEAKYNGISLTAAVGRENVIGVQFHPEKSGDAGLQFLRQWAWI